uniref:Uncharacterized protein n=1 Tax=Arundo donax TaxID=35708 RepID=A0A0A9A0T3_ARUDO
MSSGEMAEGEPAKSNEVAKKSKSSKKDKKKASVVSPSLPRESKPEMDDSDDPDFWVPPVGSRWDMMMEKTDGSPLRGRTMQQRMKVHLVVVVRVIMIMKWLTRMILNQGNLLQGRSE